MRLLPYIILLFFLLATIQPLAHALTVTRHGWPWTGTEPFPWLEYLKQLAQQRGEPLQGVKLTIITRHEATIITKAKEAFLNSPVAQELGIEDIRALLVGPELWDYYLSRGGIDVAWGGGPTLFNFIDEKGYVMPLDNNTHPEFNAVLYEMQKIPERIAGAETYKVGSDGYVHWIGAAISSFGFTVNHDILNQYGLPMPHRWIDLTRPEYGQYLPDVPLVGIADPLKSTSNTRMYEIILQAYGWEAGWRALTMLAANAKIYDASSAVRDAVTRGDIAVGITIDFYGYTAMHQNPSCEYIIPENESIVNADPIAIIKDTQYPIHAAAFVAWVLSEYGGQQVWLDTDINRLPINERVFDTDIGQQRQDLKQAFETATSAGIILFNETLSGMTERAMQWYFKATLVNIHDDLQNVWAAIVQAYLSGQIDENTYNYLLWKLTDPFPFQDPLTGQEVTFTLEYAMKINDKITESEINQQLVNEWEEGARAKYAAVYNELMAILNGEKTVTEIVTPITSIFTVSPQTTTTATLTTTPTSETTTPSQTSPIQTTPTTTTSTQTSTPTKATTPTTTTTTTKTTSPSGGDMTSVIAAVVIIVLIIIVAAFYYLRK